ECGTPLRSEVVIVRRQRVGPVSIALCPRERVVAKNIEALTEAPVETEDEPLVSRVGRGFCLVDVAFIREGSNQRTRQRCVDIACPELMYAASVNSGQRANEPLRQLLLDDAIEVDHVGGYQIRIERADQCLL